jgi:two-component system sensor histidine kinase KdpD
MIETFQRPIVIFLPGAEGLVTRFRSPEFAFDESESAAAAWVSKNGEDAGMGTGMFAASKTRYLPLKTWRGVVGVLGFQPNTLKEWLPDN